MLENNIKVQEDLSKLELLFQKQKESPSPNRGEKNQRYDGGHNVPGKMCMKTIRIF